MAIGLCASRPLDPARRGRLLGAREEHRRGRRARRSAAFPSFGWGEVYPTLIAPAWALFDDPFRAYHAALGINALLMSLAAIPAYFLARMFVSRRAAIVVAAMTLLVPSMTYTGVVMTENACYPVFLLALLLVARAVRTPSYANQALALLGLALSGVHEDPGHRAVGAYFAAVAGLCADRST